MKYKGRRYTPEYVRIEMAFYRGWETVNTNYPKSNDAWRWLKGCTTIEEAKALGYRQALMITGQLAAMKSTERITFFNLTNTLILPRGEQALA